MQNRSSRDDWNQPRLSDRHGNEDEDEDDYAVPEEDYDDGMVHIQPAKHCPTNTDYADRGHHRPIPSVPAGRDTNFNPPPRPQRRAIPGPAVNRDLKPGRQAKNKTGFSNTSTPEAHENLRTPLRPFKPVPAIPAHDTPVVGPKPSVPGQAMTSQIRSPLKERQKIISKDLPLPSGPKSRSLTPSRLSLDLESQELFDARQVDQTHGTEEMQVMKRHHEWPQDKDDLEHTNFHPQERPAEMSDWYVGAFSRVEAEHALHLVNREGAFLVRDCSKCTPQEPLVLAVFYDNRVFNVQIRYSKCTSKYTLGTGLRTNDVFDTVADIIKFHSIFPIALIDGRSPHEDTQRRTCVLMYPVTRADMLQLLSMKT